MADGRSARPPLQRILVFCGASMPRKQVYIDAARELGFYLADHGMTLIFGGSDSGTMKILADAVLAHGGKVIGVFTSELRSELLHKGITEAVVTKDLAERKSRMLAMADAAIALPGSIGTLDELFDAAARKKVRADLCAIPLGLLNTNGYYDALTAFLRHTAEEGFSKEKDVSMILSAPDPETLFKLFASA